MILFDLVFYRALDDVSHLNCIYGVKGQLDLKTALNLIAQEKWSNDLVALFEFNLNVNPNLLYQLVTNLCLGQMSELDSISLVNFLSLLTFDDQLLSSLGDKIIEVVLEVDSSSVKIALLNFAQLSLPKTMLNVHILFKLNDLYLCRKSVGI